MDFAPLPLLPDLGLPQAFSCDLDGASFDFAVYANMRVPEADPPETAYDLGHPGAPGFLVIRVAGNDASGPRVLLLRKLVPEPDLVHAAGPLALRLTAARIARGNLNGAGSFGTRITIEAARRWA